jgi:hypothetical protein
MKSSEKLLNFVPCNRFIYLFFHWHTDIFEKASDAMNQFMIEQIFVCVENMHYFLKGFECRLVSRGMGHCQKVEKAHYRCISRMPRISGLKR